MDYLYDLTTHTKMRVVKNFTKFDLLSLRPRNAHHEYSKHHTYPYRRFGHPYTQALLSAVPGVRDDRARRLYSIPGAVPENYPELTGCRFAERCPYAEKCAAQGELTRTQDGREVRCDQAAAEERRAYGA